MDPQHALTHPDRSREHDLLAVEIEKCGFYPDLVLEGIDLALAGQPLLGSLVHHEATFADSGLHRHLTVLAITPTRLLVAHTDEHPTDGQVQAAISSVEAVTLSRIYSVVLSRIVLHPEQVATGGSVLHESWLSLGWGSLTRLDLEPADCGDPECLGDHGYTGTQAVDDLVIRMSEAADGKDATRKLVDFTGLLQRTIGHT